jgi:hypothetical protein
MRATLRFIAAVFLLIAVLAAVYDGTRTLAAHTLVTTSLLEHWSKIAPTLLNAAQAGVKRASHPLVWDAGIAPLLRLPAAVILAIVGVLLAYAGRRRSRTNIYAN